MNSGSNDIDANDMNDLAEAQRESLAADAALLVAAQDDAPPPAPAPSPAPAPAPAPAAAPTPAAAPAAAAPAAAPAEAPAEQPKGDLRGALRASRHQERLNRDRADTLARENEELRKLIPAANGTLPAIDDKLKGDLEQYAPTALTAIEERDAEIARLRKQITVAPAPTPSKEFKPDVLPANVQELVDDIPELVSWQNDPDKQSEWTAAVDADIFLSGTAAWKGKPLADRMVEAVKMVKTANATAAPAPAPAPAPAAPTAAELQARLDAIPVAQRTVTAGGLRSGEMPDNEIPDFHQMAAKGMSDEEIMARLN